MSKVCSEVVWLLRLVAELGVQVSDSVKLLAYNTNAISIATNHVLHDRTKHFETHLHYIRDLVCDNAITLSYITSEDQTEDFFTKAVPTSRHWFLSFKLMLRTHHQFAGGC